MSDGVMTYEDWLRGCVHHDGRNGYVTLPCDEVLKIADFIERLRKSNADNAFQDVESVGSVDRKTENSSEKPNNSTCSKMEQVDKDKPQTEYTPDCPFCKRYGTEDCLGFDCKHYKTYKDEPQTCSVNGRPYDCGNCEYHKCTADEPQTERPCDNCQEFDCYGCEYKQTERSE